jgi:hypothetical protein
VTARSLPKAKRPLRELEQMLPSGKATVFRSRVAIRLARFSRAGDHDAIEFEKLNQSVAV